MGLYGLCNHDDHNLYICKKIMINDDLGCKNLLEIDILHRLKHPFILSPKTITIKDKTISLLFPFASQTLKDISNDKYLPSCQKIPLFFKISLALDHLHQHNILYPDLRDTNIIIKDGDPLLTDFSNIIIVDDVKQESKLDSKNGTFYAPELLVDNIYDEKTDVWALGMLIMSVMIGGKFSFDNKQYQFYYNEYSTSESIDYQAFVIDVVTNNMTILLKNISNNYRDQCVGLLTQIFNHDRNSRPTAKEISKHKLFKDCPIDDQIIEEKEKEKEMKYAADHREILKLLIQFIRMLYGTFSMESLFLAVDLFNRTGCFFTDRTTDDRTLLAIASIWVAIKITTREEIKPDELIAAVHDIVPGVTKENIIATECEIIQLLEGNINELILYRSCTTVDQLAVAFEDIIMNKDSTLYCSTNVEEWIILVRATIPDGNSKIIAIKDFFG